MISKTILKKRTEEGKNEIDAHISKGVFVKFDYTFVQERDVAKNSKLRNSFQKVLKISENLKSIEITDSGGK